MGVGHRFRLVRVQRQLVVLNQLTRNEPNLQAFQQRNQAEVDPHEGAKNNRLAGRADGVFDLIGPNVFDRLQWSGKMDLDENPVDVPLHERVPRYSDPAYE